MTDMKRCRTCKHWDAPNDLIEEPGYRACGRARHRDNGHVFNEDAPMMGEGSYAEYTAFGTKADFGCAEHEEKEDG